MKNRKDFQNLVDQAKFLMCARSNFIHTEKYRGPVQCSFYGATIFFNRPCLRGSECLGVLIVELIRKQPKFSKP